jgi:hypothetical protein
MAKFCEKQYDVDSLTVEFTFSDGTTRSYALRELPEEIQQRLMIHGALQKGGDSYASVKGNVSEGVASLDKVFENLSGGRWTAGREEGEAKPRTTELAEAFSRIKGVSIEEAQAAVEAATEDQRKNLRKHDRVKAVIAQIRAEKAAAKLAKSGAEDVDL